MASAQPEPQPQPEPKPEQGDGRTEERWILFREVVVFQLKMLLEGVRDVLLVPLTLLAGVVGIAFGGPNPRRYLHDVLRAGERFDRWLNLFEPIEDAERSREGVDVYFNKLEKVLVEQHRRGGVTAQAKTVIDDALDAVESRVGERAGRPKDERSSAERRPDERSSVERRPDERHSDR